MTLSRRKTIQVEFSKTQAEHFATLVMAGKLNDLGVTNVRSVGLLPRSGQRLDDLASREIVTESVRVMQSPSRPAHLLVELEQESAFVPDVEREALTFAFRERGFSIRSNPKAQSLGERLLFELLPLEVERIAAAINAGEFAHCRALRAIIVDPGHTAAAPGKPRHSKLAESSWPGSMATPVDVAPKAEHSKLDESSGFGSTILPPNYVSGESSARSDVPREYSLTRKLGVGGLGQVWEAVGPGGVRVALRFLDAELAQGCASAVELMKAARHPNVVSIIGTWSQENSLVVGMELCEGTLLDRLRTFRNAGMPFSDLIQHMEDAAKGIDYLNSVGIVHRNVKPQNLLLCGGAVKVSCSPIAFMLHSVTKGPGIAGTPAYMAPELFRDQVTANSDQYSLGVTYCQLRTGVLPFQLLDRVLLGQNRGSPEITMLPEAERLVVARCLAGSWQDRWPSCLAFVDVLRRAAASEEAATSGIHSASRQHQ